MVRKKKTISLSRKSAVNWHIVLLRFIDLDYSRYTEFDVPAVPGDMEYMFTCDKEIDPESGLKIKFEIFGIRHAANGSEQKSAVSSKALVIK